jgi:hypothetical protein
MYFMDAKGGMALPSFGIGPEDAAPRTFTFQTPEKVEEVIRRGGGMGDLVAKQAVAHGLDSRCAGVFLSLTEEQYRTLETPSPKGRLLFINRGITSVGMGCCNTQHHGKRPRIS